jgi:PAS domain S-box-containing protein
MNIFVLSSLSAAAIMALLGGFVLIKAPRNPLNRAYFFFCLAVAYIGFLEFEIRTAADAAEALRWVRASSFWTLAPAAFFHFAFLYTRRRGARRRGWIVPAIYAIALGSGFLYFATDLLIRGVQKESWGWTASSVPSPLASVVMAAVSLIGLIPVWLCVRHFQLLKDPVERRRAGTVTFGYLVPVLFFLLTEILSPRLRLNLPEITTLGSFLGALIIWFGIWRFKLFVLSPRTAAEDIVSMMADALLLVGMDGSIRLANRSALRLLGYSEKEIVGMPVEAFLAEADQNRVRGKAFLDMIKAFSASDLETTLIAKGSRAVPVSMSKSVITDSQGVPQGIVMVVRDLTEREKSEEELGRYRGHLEEMVEKRTLELDQANRRLQEEIADRIRAAGALDKSEERFRSLFENLTIGLYRTTPDGRILLANPTLIRMLGYEAYEDLGRRNLEEEGFEASYPRSAFKERIEKEGEIRGLESAWKRRDGTTIFVRESARAIRDAAGNVLYYEGTVEDISARRAAQEALQASEKKYRELADLLPQVLFETDAQGILTYTNRSAFRIFGYDKEDFGRGLSVLDMIIPEQRSAALDLFRQAMGGEGLDNSELVALRKDGGRFPVIIYIRPIVKDGRPAGLSGIAADVSLVKQTEEALKASLREKEVLLREIHHRVKNNMQIISSLLNLQAREIADPAVVQMFKESQGRIRAMAFVHERLYRSKDLSRVGLSEYIGSLLAHLSRIYVINAERIRFETEIEDIALEISTAIPCGLLINELVTNSLKHAFPGDRAGTIRLEMRRRSAEGGDRFLLRVADDGVGFPQGLDFQMTESLGMQIILMLVDQIDGAIEREPGLGTAFRIEFGEVKYRTKY